MLFSRITLWFVSWITAAICLSGAAFCQVSDGQIWTSQSVSGTISGKVQGEVDSIQRFGNAADGLYQVTSSVALGYRLSDSIVFWAGYVDSPNYNHGASTYLEQRAREDVVASLGHVAGGFFVLRGRFEERWRNDGRDTGWRGRYRLTWTRPFYAGGKTALVVSHESYLNFNTTDWGQRKGYERMRNAVSIVVPVLDRVTGSVGYLNQYGFVRGGRDTSDNVATFALAWTF